MVACSCVKTGNAVRFCQPALIEIDDLRMNTITITFHHTTNYGATFQTFALHSYIRSLGHENHVVETSSASSFYNKCEEKSFRSLLICLYVNFFKFLRRKAGLKLIDEFQNFKFEHIKFTKCYDTYAELKADDIDADCLITGSDQVWNMHTTPEYVNARFLEFGREKAIRFSYAASIRVMDYTQEQKKYVKTQLSKFKGISVREDSANKYLKAFIDKKIETIIDPVFLKTREEWDAISKDSRIQEEKYILCYQVVSNDRMQEVVNFLSKKTGYKIVSICCDSIKWIKSDYSFFDVSPQEFLGFYKNASIVVTTSFHGTALSLIYNKPVYSLVKGYSANRIVDLMNLCKLSEFVIDSDSKIPSPESIKWDKVNSLLDVKITEAKDYLNRMLNEE